MSVKPSRRKHPYSTQTGIPSKKTSPKVKRMAAIKRMVAIKRMARPKTGRKTYPHSLSLTLEQIAFLNTVPNASELVRKMLNDLIAIQKDVEPSLSLLSLKYQIDMLEKQREKLWDERSMFRGQYSRQMYEDQFTREKPIQTPEATYLRKQEEAYTRAIESLDAKLKELKDKFMKG